MSGGGVGAGGAGGGVSGGYVPPAPPTSSTTDPNQSSAGVLSALANVDQQVGDAVSSLGFGKAAAAGPPRNIGTLPIQWNPPPHLMTRPPKISWNNYDPRTKDTAGGAQLRRGGQFIPRFGRLGAIYTDDFTASAAVEMFTDTRYGCQFHYNPTSVGYSAASDTTSINAQTQATDPNALILPGTIGMTFEVYFNRIYDMATGTSDKHYERPLRRSGHWWDDEAVMIREIGTEYDIEYLYRAVNGDPQQVRHVDRKTADVGFMVRNLTRLHIGAFQYIGFIDSINVNHILFTEEMVPTFTSVTISFSRQVTLGQTLDAARTLARDYTGGTTSTASDTATP